MASETFSDDSSSGSAQDRAICLCRSYLSHRGWKVEDKLWGSKKAGPIIVAEDDGETVLVDVRAAEANGPETVPELRIFKDDILAMRAACLTYLLDHESIESIRHDVCVVSVVGERHARIRHLVSIVRWDGTC